MRKSSGKCELLLAIVEKVCELSSWFRKKVRLFDLVGNILVNNLRLRKLFVELRKKMRFFDLGREKAAAFSACARDVAGNNLRLRK